MRALLLFLACLVATSGAAQTIPDTTSAWRYVPLALGDAWQYDVLVEPGEIPGYGYTLVRRVVADTTVDGQTYAIMEERSRVVNPAAPSPPPDRRYLVRFDTASARVVERAIGVTSESPALCPLDVPFPENPNDPTLLDCVDGVFATASGGYDQPVEIGGQSYTRTSKTLTIDGVFSSVQTYVPEIGLTRSTFEEINSITLDLVTARVGGTWYGAAPEADFPGIPDTTDAARYYPLAVGDVWQYKLCVRLLIDEVCNGRDEITLREVVGTDVISDTTYAVVQDRVFARESEQDEYIFTSESQRLLRFDHQAATVRVREEGGVERTDSCPLNADFEAVVQSPECYYAYVSGHNGDQPVKGFMLGTDAGLAYQADVGYLGRAIYSTTTETLVYSRVGGVERGIPVPVGRETAPEAQPLALSAAPNPTSGPLAVTLRQRQPGTVRLEAFDVRGRRVLSRDVPASGETVIDIDASAWSPGLYVVRAVSAGASATVRVVRR